MQTLEIKSRTLQKRFKYKELLVFQRFYMDRLSGRTLTFNGVECLRFFQYHAKVDSRGKIWTVELGIEPYQSPFADDGHKCGGSIESLLADGWEQEVEYGRGDVHMKINASCDGFARSLNGLADLFDQRTPLIGAGGTVTISQPDDEPKQRYTIQPKPKSLLAFQYVWVSIAVAGFALMVSKILNPRGTILEYSAVYSILLSVFWSVRACLEIARRLRNRHGRDPVLGINFRATNA